MRPILKQCVCYNMCNGKKVLFWKYSWINAKPLIDWAPNELSGDQKKGVVDDYWQYGQKWKWEIIGSRVLEDIRVKMNLMDINNNKEEEDKPYWTLESSSKFSVTTSYHNINAGNIAMQDK